MTMTSAKSVLLIILLFGTAMSGARAQVPDPDAKEYTPEQVISTLHKAIKLAVQPPANTWLSLSMVGAVAEEEDPLMVNDLANFCPDASPVIDDPLATDQTGASFTSVRRIDGVYKTILDGLTGPYRPYTEAYMRAREYLRKGAEDTAEYKAYKEYSEKYSTAVSEYLSEKDDAQQQLLLYKARQIEKDWLIGGYRNEVDLALRTIELGETKFGEIVNAKRANILAYFRGAGIPRAEALGPGSYRAPLSELSPPVKLWKNDTGWAAFSFSSQIVRNSYDATYSKNHGFGGLSLGFVNLVGSGGGGKSNEKRVSKVYDLSYSFDLKRIVIRRPWLDTEVFFEPPAWTWKRSNNTAQYPHVGVGTDAEGIPQRPPHSTYDNTPVACTLLPTELIIARKRSVTATVSKSDYTLITTSGSSGGGGSLFGILGGGGSRSWTTTNVRDNNDTVTFTVDAPSVAVIGYISQIIPRLPNPNMADVWPQNAWLEEPQ